MAAHKAVDRSCSNCLFAAYNKAGPNCIPCIITAQRGGEKFSRWEDRGVREDPPVVCLRCGQERPEIWEGIDYHSPDCIRSSRRADFTVPTSDRMVSFQDNGGPALEDEAPQKVKSDGGSSTYYFLPKDATELNDLIEHKNMSFARGNLFKALYRLDEKDGIDAEYDLNKCQLFLDRLRGMARSGKRL